jgi:hypothetical protein
MDSISYDLCNLAACLEVWLRTSLVQLSTHMGRVRISLYVRWRSLSTLLGHLWCHEGNGLRRATTSLLLWSPQIQSLNINQLVIGNHFLYSQSIMVIHANANYCTH